MSSPGCGQCGHIFDSNTLLKDYLDPSTGILFCRSCWDTWNAQSSTTRAGVMAHEQRPQSAAPSTRTNRRAVRQRSHSGKPLAASRPQNSGMHKSLERTDSGDFLMAQWPPELAVSAHSEPHHFDVGKADERPKTASAGHVGRLRVRKIKRRTRAVERPMTAAGRMVNVCEEDIESLKRHMKSQSDEMKIIHARSEKRAELLAQSQEERRALEELLNRTKTKSDADRLAAEEKQKQAGMLAESKLDVSKREITDKPESESDEQTENHWRDRFFALDADHSANKFHLANARTRLCDSRADCTQLRKKLEEEQGKVNHVPETCDTSCQANIERFSPLPPCLQCTEKECQIFDLHDQLANALAASRRERERADELSVVVRALEGLVAAGGLQNRTRTSLEMNSNSGSRRGSTDSHRSRRSSRVKLPLQPANKHMPTTSNFGGTSLLKSPWRDAKTRERITTTPNPFHFELDRRFPQQE